ncbi:hypothetical protein [Peribacillus muralis]|uniref:hypothetical protein n=1 Tax=Peribacillus muralis TaxID=264697 RepID=UPI003D0821B1
MSKRLNATILYKKDVGYLDNQFYILMGLLITVTSTLILNIINSNQSMTPGIILILSVFLVVYILVGLKIRQSKKWVEKVYYLSLLINEAIELKLEGVK